MPLAGLLASAAQQATQYKEDARLAASNLDDVQQKLQCCSFQDKQKADTIQDLQRELQKLQKGALIAEEELTSNRYLQQPSWEASRTTLVSGPEVRQRAHC
jgi:hypothetical protein